MYNNILALENLNQITEITLYSDGSAIPNPGKAGSGVYGIDNLNNEYNLSEAIGVNITNNIAELVAFTNALKIINTLPNLNTATIFTDSSYVLSNITRVDNWKNNNWISSSGKPVANVDYWILLTLEYDKAITKVKDFKYRWCKGHSGNHGNELADELADVGRKLNISNNKIKFDITNKICNKGLEIMIDKPMKEIKPKVEKVVLNPKISNLLSGKRWIFNTNMPDTVSLSNPQNLDTDNENDRFFYTTSTYKEEKTKEGNADKVQNQNVGKRNADTHYCIFLTKEKIPELDILRNLYNNKYKKQFVPVVVSLVNTTKAKIWNEIKDTKLEGKLAVATDSSVLADVIFPPKLVFKIESFFNYGFNLIKCYLDKNVNYKYIDITDKFYNIGKKRQEFKKEIVVGQTLLVLKDINIYDNKTTDVKLILGIDAPLRNNLSNIVKDNVIPVKVTLIVFDVSDFSYRIATVIEHGTNLAVYYNPDANYRITK